MNDEQMLQDLERPKMAADGLEASWDDLVDALLRRWPGDVRGISIFLGPQVTGDNIFYCFVKLPPELMGEVTKIIERERPKDPNTGLTQSKALYRDLAEIFSRLSQED